MTRYLIDTNHLGEAVGRVSKVRDRIQQMTRRGDVFATCGPVLCELMIGIVHGANFTATSTRLNRLLQAVRLWPINLAFAGYYADVYHELKNGGRVLSQVDMMLAALARCECTILLTSIKTSPHFQTSRRKTGSNG